MLSVFTDWACIFMLGRYQRKKRSFSRTNSKNPTKQQQVKDNTQLTKEGEVCVEGPGSHFEFRRCSMAN